MNRFEVLDFVLKNGVPFLSKFHFPQCSINAQDNMGLTPLHWAAAKGHMDSVKACLKMDPDLDIVDSKR